MAYSKKQINNRYKTKKLEIDNTYQNEKITNL